MLHCFATAMMYQKIQPLKELRGKLHSPHTPPGLHLIHRLAWRAKEQSFEQSCVTVAAFELSCQLKNTIDNNVSYLQYACQVSQRGDRSKHLSVSLVVLKRQLKLNPLEYLELCTADWQNYPRS